jgi:hypothetical protein
MPRLYIQLFFLIPAILGVIIMIGGAAMVLATIISNTFSAVPVEEFSVLSTMESHSKIQLSSLKNDELSKKLQARQKQLDKILLELKQVYFDVCESNEMEMGDLEELGYLELALRGQSEYLKKIWRDHHESIVTLHGEDVYNVFRNIVGTVGQIRKNVTNILSVEDSLQITDDNNFKPTAAFAELASMTSQENFNYH